MNRLYRLWIDHRSARWAAIVGICAVVIAAVIYDNGPPPLPQPDPPERLASVDELVEHFKEMATYHAWQLEKWVAPVRVAIYAEDVDLWRPMVEAQLAVIESLTPLDFTIIESWESYEKGPNFFIEIVPYEGMFDAGRFYLSISDRRLQQTVDRAGCFVSIGPVVGAEISRVVAIITTGYPRDYVGSCMFHEILHGIGIHHSWAIQPSIMTPSTEPQALTINDKIIIRTLYDPRIEPGMSVTEARNLARVIITEIHGKLSAGETVAGIAD